MVIWGKMKTPKKIQNNKNRRIFYPRRNFSGSKKIMVWKHVPKVVKQQISFQYHISQKKKVCLFSKPLWCTPGRGFDMRISISTIGFSFEDKGSWYFHPESAIFYVDSITIYKNKLSTTDQLQLHCIVIFFVFFKFFLAKNGQIFFSIKWSLRPDMSVPIFSHFSTLLLIVV